MFARYLLSIAVGIFITAGLFFAMHLLIEVGEAALTDPRERATLTFTRIKNETEVKTIPDEILQINDPPEIPTITPPSDAESSERILVIGPGPGEPAPIPGPKPGFFVSDNALVTIIAVQPSYPASAAAKGQEGWVIVEFDVNSAGGVQNAKVLESSHRVFDKAAVKAALRFRFKARVVDGAAAPSYGVRRMFRFEMDDE